MDQTPLQSGVQISHLLQIQAQLTKAINDAVDRAKEDVLARMDEGHGHLTDRINELKAKQDIANGRVSKLERSSAALRTRLEVRLKDTAGFWQALTPVQKTKLTGLAIFVVTAVAEGVHRVIPLLIDLLGKTAP